MTTYRFFATAAKNLESLLADELRSLGAPDASETYAGARFSGSLAIAYRVCLWSRVANRVLLVLEQFPAATPEALYTGVREVLWHEHFDISKTFAVDCQVSRSTITHSLFGALKVKDAVVDQFREQFGARPSVDTAHPDIRINVHLHRNETTLSLDLSGSSLHRRGYRRQGAAAPLKENLAAAILLRAGWPEIARQGGDLIDPMCGSGTLPVEAALIAGDIAPGLQRGDWGFLGWRNHDPAAWSELLAEAKTRRADGLQKLPDIRGYDHDAAAVRVAWSNVERAELRGHVHIEKRDLNACAPLRPNQRGLVIANPPYGERLGAGSNLPALYASLGKVLKQHFRGWNAVVFTGNPELGKHLGLRAKRLRSLYNGAIECKLLHFVIVPEWFRSERPGPRPLPIEARSERAQMFANRLRKNRKRLGRWLRQEQIHCYRLYDADMPEYALAVDVYEGRRHWIHVQEYEAPASVDPRKAGLRRGEALGVILEVLAITEAELFFKMRRRQKGRAQYDKLADHKHFHEVREDGCRFWVNFEDYLDTGLFLDHRLTRALLTKLAPGTRFLNLFAYTGTATVAAALGGSVATTTVDLSNTYIEWARRNMTLNGLRDPQHEFVQADCLSWLARTSGQRQYDLIFLDPPSFSNSKRMEGTFDVQRDHVALITRAVELLSPNGTLIFSNNRREFKLDLGALSGLAVQDIGKSTLPKDFERNPRVHHCWKITHPLSGTDRIHGDRAKTDSRNGD